LEADRSPSFGVDDGEIDLGIGNEPVSVFGLGDAEALSGEGLADEDVGAGPGYARGFAEAKGAQEDSRVGERAGTARRAKQTR